MKTAKITADIESLNPSYYHLRMASPEKKRLLVVFSSRGAKPGEFSFFKTFEIYKCNVLHITPPDFSWYHTGLVGFGNDPKEAFIKLSKIIDEFCIINNIEEIVLIGSSMGGYGALLYSTLTKHSMSVRVLSFGVETILKLPNSKSEEGEFIPLDEFKDIRGFDFSHVDVNIIYGEFDLIDSYCALCMKGKPGVNLISHIFSGHNVPETVSSSIAIVEFFTQIIEDSLYFYGRGHMSSALNSRDISPLISGAQFNDEYITSLEIALKKYPTFGFGLNRLGVYYHNKDMLKEAYKLIQKSILINPKYPNSLQHLKTIEEKLANQLT
ncbi:tetratricopeptide repeat protein (plasmid) [Rahnella variigena]|jgi:hypothetical protein|uniref:tetratricopeptide repeat protein n=1 Tax=Rahnella variigena TaxID=574964 RepID=UPI003CED239A